MRLKCRLGPNPFEDPDGVGASRQREGQRQGLCGDTGGAEHAHTVLPVLPGPRGAQGSTDAIGLSAGPLLWQEGRGGGGSQPVPPHTGTGCSHTQVHTRTHTHTHTIHAVAHRNSAHMQRCKHFVHTH